MKRIFLCLATFGLLQTYAQRTQVWDFGAEPLNTQQYENMLSEAEINSWYGESITPGTASVPLPSFTANDSVNLAYNTNGASNHRLRTTNTNLTRYDSKSLTDADNNTYTGYIYSNSGSQPKVYIEQRYSAGDKVSFYVGSNGSEETYQLTAPSGALQTAKYTAAAKIEKITFYIGEDGLHRLCGLDEKLVLARIERTPVQKGMLTGNITSDQTLPNNYAVAFKNTLTNAVYTATLSGNAYQVELPLGYTYEPSLVNANGFVINNGEQFEFNADGQTKDLQIIKVTTCVVTGSITGLPADELAKLNLQAQKPEGKVFEPAIVINKTNSTYSATLEQGVQYALSALGVNDYRLTVNTLTGTEGATVNLVFEKKALWAVTVKGTLQIENEVVVPLADKDLKDIQFVFNNLNEEGYTYTFTGTDAIALRDGVYSVLCNSVPDSMKQMLTSNLKVIGQVVTKQIDFLKNMPVVAVPYRSTLNVGKQQEFTTINKALEYARRMTRETGDEVKILIEPGTYEEMLLIDIPNITLCNASATPSLELKNAGVDINENAVRITGYYGWGYSYYSMGTDFFYDERTLQVNKENGYVSVTNSQQGNALWNATVVVTAKDFTASNIIFENSYNQYISAREANDVLVETKESKGVRPTTVGSTDVQARKFRERACAIGFKKTADRAKLLNCRVISRQDAIYGDEGCRVAVDGGILNGACDYIFGGMTLVCRNTRLDMLVTSDANDIAYLTASKTSKTGRGYLFYECTIGSATPLQDMVETETAQPGYLGRPWDPNAETVFYKTTIGKSRTGASLIVPAGWHNGLVSTGSQRSYEYGSIEQAGIDNTDKRVEWATVLQSPVLPDGTEIRLYNFTKGSDEWDPFNDKTTAVEQTNESSFRVNQTAKGTLYITPMQGDTSVQIYTIDGVQLYSNTLHGESEISLTMPAGVYIVVAQNNHNQYVQKTLWNN